MKGQHWYENNTVYIYIYIRPKPQAWVIIRRRVQAGYGAGGGLGVLQNPVTLTNLFVWYVVSSKDKKESKTTSSQLGCDQLALTG